MADQADQAVQLLSALERTAELIWVAICVAVALVAIGMIVHASIVLLKRWRAGTRHADTCAWARRVGDAVLLLFGI